MAAGAGTRWRRREYVTLAVLCLWPMHLVTGVLITLFRIGHLLFPFYVVLVLAGIGVAAALRGSADRTEALGRGVCLTGLAVYGLVDHKLEINIVVVVFGLGKWFARQAWAAPAREARSRTVALLALLCSGLVLRGSLPSPKIPMIGSAPVKQALRYLAEHYDPGTAVAAGAPRIPWAARMPTSA